MSESVEGLSSEGLLELEDAAFRARLLGRLLGAGFGLGLGRSHASAVEAFFSLRW